MPDPSFSAPIDGSPDVADTGPDFPWDLSNAEAVRRAYLHEENYIKAMSKVGLLQMFSFMCITLYPTACMVMHLTGKLFAPRAIRADWLAMHADCWLLVFCSFAAACGFRLRKTWALWFEGIVGLGTMASIIVCLYTYMHYRGVHALREVFVLLLLLVSSLVPTINLPDVWRSLVFQPEYRQVIAATPAIRARGKLGWDLKLPMLVMVLTAIWLRVRL